MAQQESRGGARVKRNGVAVMEMGGPGERPTEEEAEATWARGAVAAGVAALGLAGAGVLVWWAVAFHPAHEQLWMVPVGLVLLGTPLVTWLSLFASGACWLLGRLRAGDDQPPLAPER